MSSSVDPEGYGVMSKKTVVGWLARADPQESPETQRKHKLYRRVCFALAVLTAIAVLVLFGCLAYFFLFLSEPDVNERPGNNNTYTDPIDDNGTTSASDSWTANQLKKYMNLSVSPCDDFYEYACGGWLGKREVKKIPLKMSLLSAMNDTLDQQLIKLLRRLPSERDPPYRLQSKRYFVACSNTGRLNQRGPKPFLDFLNDMGKFPLLDTTWNTNDFWITTATAKLTELNMNHIFNVRAGPYGNGTSLFISPTDIPVMQEELVPKWIAFNLKQLGLNLDDNYFARAIPKILEFETYLREIGKSSNETVRLLSTFELDKELPMITWKTFLDMVIPAKMDLTFALKHRTYFDNLTKTSFYQSTIKNFLLKQVMNLTLCLGPRFKPVEAFLPSKVEPDRQRMCLRLTRETLPDQLARLYVDDIHRLESDAFAEEIVAHMKDIISNKSSENQFFDPAASSTASSEVNLIQVKSGFMESLLDTQALNNIFKMESSSEFFESHLAFLKYRFNQTFFSKNVTSSWLSRHSPLDLDLDYDHIEHYLTLPAAFLQPPVMNSSWPSSLKYGALGSYLGRELATIFLHVLFAGSKSPKDEENKARDCFIQQYKKYVFDGYQIKSEEPVNENILDYEGLTLGYEAFEAYRSTVDKKEPTLPGLNLSHEQLFFLAYAQRQCQHIPIEMSEAEITEGRLPNKIKVLGSLKNSKEFAEAFKCKPGSPMNPVSKCRFI